MKKYSAPYIFIGNGAVVENTVVITDEDGKILALESVDNHDSASIQFVEGVITPGHINTHCHLELSHMKNKVDTGTSLLPFLINVVSFRNIDEEEIKAAIVAGDAEMYQNGIVAVGDISNKADTAAVKASSKLAYFTFVEMFDFLQPHLTESTFAQYQAVYEAHEGEGKNRKSFVPHAPYTVTKGLFDKVNSLNKSGTTISIHNQETPAENQLFLEGTGGFMDFYKGFGFSLDQFEPLGKSAIHYIIQSLKPDFKTLLVHNTTSTLEDIQAALAWNAQTYWASCPNANLYIENRLPDYKAFLNANAQVTLGTDSLTSNWQLSIAEEMYTIAKYCSYVPFETLVQWACENGAKALGFEENLGTITQGKTPGLVQMHVSKLGERFVMQDAVVKRLI